MKWFGYFMEWGTRHTLDGSGWSDDQHNLGSILNVSIKSLWDETVNHLQSPAGPTLTARDSTKLWLIWLSTILRLYRVLQKSAASFNLIFWCKATSEAVFFVFLHTYAHWSAVSRIWVLHSFNLKGEKIFEGTFEVKFPRVQMMI